MYRRGRISNRMQHWVLGGVCRYSFDVYICIYRLFLGETGEAFLEECPNNNRDRKTLEEIILK
jgi:hypothetical protein